MGLEYRSAQELKLWEDNPRYIKEADYNLLKQKIKRWGQFKPIIITPDNIVIGGNMRLRAYRDLGIDKVWVSVVTPKSDAEKLEIAMADNELAGRWQRDELAEMVSHYEEIDLGDYHLDLGGDPKTLEELMGEYNSPDMPTARDSVTEKELKCPHCGESIFVVI
jgi:ParB-like chromosome segregation protein Spo0J